MKKIILTAVVLSILSGCVTRKVRVLPQAVNISPITDVALKILIVRWWTLTRLKISILTTLTVC